MTKKKQVILLAIAAFTAISVTLTLWVQQCNTKSDIDDITELVNIVNKDIPHRTRYSYTSCDTGITNLLLYNYALISMAPRVITDEHFQNDTILSLDLVEHFKSNYYDQYTVVNRTFNNTFVVQLLVKK